jgi:hypothetical protein
LAVFVLDKRKKPLVPCSKKRSRLLLTHGPMIRLNDRIGSEIRPLLVKIDRGSKTTGIAVVTDEDGNIAKAQRINGKSCQFIQRADRYGFAVPASPLPVFARPAFHPRLPATVASGGF